MEKAGRPATLYVEVERESDIEQAVTQAVAKWVEERARAFGLTADMVRGVGMHTAKIEITVVTE